MSMSYDEMAQTISDAVEVLGIELNTLLRENNDRLIDLLAELNDIVIILARRVEKNKEDLQSKKNLTTINLITLVMNIVLFVGCWGFYVLN